MKWLLNVFFNQDQDKDLEFVFVGIIDQAASTLNYWIALTKILLSLRLVRNYRNVRRPLFPCRVLASYKLGTCVLQVALFRENLICYSSSSDCVWQSTMLDRNFKSEYIGAFSQSSIYNFQNPWDKWMKIQFVWSYQRQERPPSIHDVSSRFRSRSILWSANTNFTAQYEQLNGIPSSLENAVGMIVSSLSFRVDKTLLKALRDWIALMYSWRLWSNWLWPGATSSSNGRLETLFGLFDRRDSIAMETQLAQDSRI